MSLLKKILFLDLEPYNSNKNKEAIREIGIVLEELCVKNNSSKQILEYIKSYDIKYICGHNLRTFDIEYLKSTSLNTLVNKLLIIDTLELSLLFFSENTIHKLSKSYKDSDRKQISDPLKDALITKDLLLKLIDRYNSLSEEIQIIYYSLLSQDIRFKPFFELINISFPLKNLKNLILKTFKEKIQVPKNLESLINQNPIELAHILSVLNESIEIKSFPLKIFKDYPNIQDMMNSITFNQKESIKKLDDYAMSYFGFSGFNSFPKQTQSRGLFGFEEKVSQKEIVKAAIEGEDLLAVLPTGGGKTFTFWLPAIIKAKATRGLTLVISPLQALMKDHIFNFNKKLIGIASAEALSGYLTLPERRLIIEQILNGKIDILYVAPESLRSKNIERILSYRFIDRIVIDEAHCLSTWGNDFRHDYFYITQFIKKLLDNKYNQNRIPISCFTATANTKTIQDIKDYFANELDITFTDYIASPKRTNLTYEAICYTDKKEKSKALIEKVRHLKEPLLIYNPSSRRECELIAQQLNDDLNRPFSAFHAGLKTSEKQKALDDFINDEVDGITATTAFGMGIDKPNIRHVLHNQPSSSLEDYMQEAGRAGRDRKPAKCYVLYNDEDFDKLFLSLIRQKVTHAEIRKIFQAARKYSGEDKEEYKRVIVSVQELAEKAGIKVDEEQTDFDTKVKTALLELERVGYLKRGYNHPKVWVTSIHFNDMGDLRFKLSKNGISEDSDSTKKKILFESIILISKELIKRSAQKFSLGIEKLSEIVNIEVDDLYKVLELMRELELVSLKEDMVIDSFAPLKNQKLLDDLILLRKYFSNSLIDISHERFKLKDLKQNISNKKIYLDFKDYSLLFKQLMINCSKRGVFEFYRKQVKDQYWKVKIYDEKKFNESLEEFIDVTVNVIQYLTEAYKNKNDKQEKLVVPFEKLIFDTNNKLEKKYSTKIYDKVITFLHNLHLLRLEGGRVLHHLKVELLINKSISNNKQYTKQQYKERMDPMYARKRASIHIMNHFVNLLTKRPNEAEEFSTDYFTMEFDDFIKKYSLSKVIKLPVSKARYDKIRKGLTSEQEEIVLDDKSQTMLILAGPGTGKTMVMVNKIAYMILEEDYKPEHFLMLTYTRTAAHEFKQRLFSLLGDLAYDIDIFTFHSYATEILGKSFNKNQKSDELHKVISEATEMLNSDELEMPFKNAIILDEFQDTNSESFSFIKALYNQFSKETDIRIIAVGDDDQCIMEMTNGANINFIRKFVDSFTNENKDKKKWYRLSQNFRSKKTIVDACNSFCHQIVDRIDKKKLIVPSKENNFECEVNLIYYKNPNFISDLYELVKKSTSETIALLVHTNEQVMDIYSILKEDTTLDVSYLLKNEGFHLYMLDEIVSFTKYIENNLDDENKIISHSLFDNAKDFIRKEYSSSKNLSLTMQHILEFENDHELITMSFWEAYTYETLVGVLKNLSSKIVVSTIHRAKGKEWNEVHVILPELHSLNTPDYFLRLYYVALSRAKEKLFVHTIKNKYFDCLELKNIKVNYNPKEEFKPLQKRILIMQLEDVYLSFLSKNKNSLNYIKNTNIFSGQEVFIERFSYYHNSQNNIGFNIKFENTIIGKFSSSFSKKILVQMNKGYSISESSIEFIPRWYDNENDSYVNIFLCRLVLEKNL